MKISCIGTGFVGVVTASVLAKLGHQVIGIDIDPRKIDSLKHGEVPFYEPGLSELLVETQRTGNLSFTTDYAAAIPNSQIVMIMVGTPSLPSGEADLSYVLAAARSAAPHLSPDTIVIIKSTVPPGTNQVVAAAISELTPVSFEMASVPEFLKEGTAVEDTLKPDRVIIGASSQKTAALIRELHAPLTTNIVLMSPESAQMAKYAGNLYLALRITFANELANLCEHNGAQIDEVIAGIGQDRRIGSHYWYPGLGYGGSCFPKDVKEMAAYAKNVGESDNLFVYLDALNTSRIPRLMAKYAQAVGGWSGKRVAVLGLSFKPNTNDTRVAPALAVIPELITGGATVVATDPKAIAEARVHLPDSVQYVESSQQALAQAEVVFMLVEWPEYTQLSPSEIAALVAPHAYFIDTRNQFVESEMRAAGLQYLGIGR